jgi:hypothetical protein
MVALPVLILIPAAIYAITLPLREDVRFSSRHPAYLVLVAPRAVVRSFPLHQAISDSTMYEHDAADGPAPARLTVTFATLVEPAQTLEEYSRICSARGYQPVTSPGPVHVQCRAPGYAITVGASKQENRNEVSIVFEEEP